MGTTIAKIVTMGESLNKYPKVKAPINSLRLVGMFGTHPILTLKEFRAVQQSKERTGLGNFLDRVNFSLSEKGFPKRYIGGTLAGSLYLAILNNFGGLADLFVNDYYALGYGAGIGLILGLTYSKIKARFFPPQAPVQIIPAEEKPVEQIRPLDFDIFKETIGLVREQISQHKEIINAFLKASKEERETNTAKLRELLSVAVNLNKIASSAEEEDAKEAGAELKKIRSSIRELTVLGEKKEIINEIDLATVGIIEDSYGNKLPGSCTGALADADTLVIDLENPEKAARILHELKKVRCGTREYLDTYFENISKKEPELANTIKTIKEKIKEFEAGEEVFEFEGEASFEKFKELSDEIIKTLTDVFTGQKSKEVVEAALKTKYEKLNDLYRTLNLLPDTTEEQAETISRIEEMMKSIGIAYLKPEAKGREGAAPQEAGEKDVTVRRKPGIPQEPPKKKEPSATENIDNLLAEIEKSLRKKPKKPLGGATDIRNLMKELEEHIAELEETIKHKNTLDGLKKKEETPKRLARIKENLSLATKKEKELQEEILKRERNLLGKIKDDLESFKKIIKKALTKVEGGEKIPDQVYSCDMLVNIGGKYIPKIESFINEKDHDGAYRVLTQAKKLISDNLDKIHDTLNVTRTRITDEGEASRNAITNAFKHLYTEGIDITAEIERGRFMAPPEGAEVIEETAPTTPGGIRVTTLIKQLLEDIRPDVGPDATLEQIIEYALNITRLLKLMLKDTSTTLAMTFLKEKLPELLRHEKEIDEIKKALGNIHMKHPETIGKIEKLIAVVKAYRDLETNNQTLVQKVGELEAKLAPYAQQEKKGGIVALKLQIDDLNVELGSLKAQVKTLTEETKRAQKEKEAAIKERDDIQAELQKKEGVELENARLTDELTEAQRRLRTEAKNIEILTKRIEEKNELIKNLENQIKSLEEDTKFKGKLIEVYEKIEEELNKLIKIIPEQDRIELNKLLKELRKAEEIDIEFEH